MVQSERERSDLSEMFQQSGMNVAELSRASDLSRNTVIAALQDPKLVKQSTYTSIRRALSKAINPDPAAPLNFTSDPLVLVDQLEHTLTKAEGELTTLRHLLKATPLKTEAREYINVITSLKRLVADIEGLELLVFAERR